MLHKEKESKSIVNNKDESQFDHILRELDRIRELASNLTAEEIESLQRQLAVS